MREKPTCGIAAGDKPCLAGDLRQPALEPFRQTLPTGDGHMDPCLCWGKAWLSGGHTGHLARFGDPPGRSVDYGRFSGPTLAKTDRFVPAVPWATWSPQAIHKNDCCRRDNPVTATRLTPGDRRFAFLLRRERAFSGPDDQEAVLGRHGR